MAELLKTLSELNGVSGNENAVRAAIISELNAIADEISVDAIGNVTALKKGKGGGKKIAVTANMDEAGLIISDITDKGYLKFKTVGEIDPRKLVSKTVEIGEDKIKGVIGMKAIHLQTKDERKSVVKPDKLFIDIGKKSKKAVQKLIKKGDYAAFCTEFEVLKGTIKGKALDRSAPCFSLIHALCGDYEHDVYACFLAQHEVGARGASILSARIKPDFLLTLGSVDTTDMYGLKDNRNGCVLGGGVAVSVTDKSFIPDKTATAAMVKAAEKAGIKTQVKTLTPFSSDGGAIQTSAGAVTTLGAAVPCRYSHSPVSLMSLDDIDAMTAYIKLFLNKIGDMI